MPTEIPRIGFNASLPCRLDRLLMAIMGPNHSLKGGFGPRLFNISMKSVTYGNREGNVVIEGWLSHMTFSVSFPHLSRYYHNWSQSELTQTTPAEKKGGYDPWIRLRKGDSMLEK